MKLHLRLKTHSTHVWCFYLIFLFLFLTLASSSLSWSWGNSRLFINWRMSAKNLSKHSLVAWPLEWISPVMYFFHNFDEFSVEFGYWFLFTINFFNCILIVSARDISSFLRDVDGTYSLSCVEVFLFRRTIFGVDLDLFDKPLEFTMVTYC